MIATQEHVAGEEPACDGRGTAESAVYSTCGGIE